MSYPLIVLILLLLHNGLVFCYSLRFKAYFVLYEYCYPSFLAIFIFRKYSFPSLHFHSMCVFSSEVCLRQAVYTGVLFFIQLDTLCLLIGPFGVLTFKYTYCHFVTCFLVVFAVLLFSSSFRLFCRGLIASAVCLNPFLSSFCISILFLICSYHGVHICWPISIVLNW